MRFSVNIPNFGDFADARAVASVAAAAEEAGWDALFLWDHVVHEKRLRRAFVVGGASPSSPAAARDLLGPLADAGATWWDERRPADEGITRLAPVLRRVREGPPPY